LGVVETTTNRELLIVHVMQFLAREEGEPFRSATLEEYQCCLLYHRPLRVFLGFLMWSNGDTEATLHQIFVVPRARRKGLAAQFLRFWVREYADQVSDRFAVESPNEKSLGLLVKLGFTTLDPKDVHESKCFLVDGL